MILTCKCNNIIYETENLKIYFAKKPLVVLSTDKGFFTDKYNKMIGKIITIYTWQDLEGNIYYDAIYPEIVQHFPGGDTWKYIFNGETYVRE